jgi:hypothetical protein
MASLYKVVYYTNLGEMQTAYATATTSGNAWAAVQSNDATATNLETIEEDQQNVYVWS